MEIVAVIALLVILALVYDNRHHIKDDRWDD